MEIYSFVADDGENVHIDSNGLRLWCEKTKPEVFWIPLRYELINEFIRDNSVSPFRIQELAFRKSFDPIIMVKDGTFGDNGGPNVMLVDGRHRYFIACMAKLEVIPGYMLEVDQWKPFQLHGIPDVTKEELKARPINKRNY
jgi:hypothetical protein